MSGESDAKTPGRYDCPIPAYPGHVTFKHPWEWQDYRAYHEALNRHKKDGPDAFDNIESAKMWRGALSSIVEWQLEGIPRAVLTEDPATLPVEVVTWVRGVFSEYASPFLSYELLLKRYSGG